MFKQLLNRASDFATWGWASDEFTWRVPVVVLVLGTITLVLVVVSAGLVFLLLSHAAWLFALIPVVLFGVAMAQLLSRNRMR